MKMIAFFPLFIVFVLASVSFSDQYLFSLGNDEIEAILLKKFPNITRDGDNLTIKTEKSTIELKSVMAEEGTNIYHFVGAIQIHDFYAYSFEDGKEIQRQRIDYLIHVGYYEGRSYILINGLTGKTIDINGYPVLSPDKKHYVVSSLGEYMPELIQIIKIRSEYVQDFNDDYEIEWEYDFERDAGGPSDPIWLNESAVVFFLNMPIYKDYDFNFYEKQPYIIEIKENEWQPPRPLK